MVQGTKKISGSRPGAVKKTNAAKVQKKLHKASQAKKGNAMQLPKGKFRDEALDDRTLTKAIDKSIEKKITAKLLQGGGKVKSQDLLQSGKELAKENRRSMVKKKVGRVEEKLKLLTEKAERDGLI